MDYKEIPVLLLTGYLGSGKTTLLNRILNNERGIKFAVIVNDIGEVNIDADLIEKGGVVGQKDDNLVALQNGCICCTLKMDLVEQLADITKQNKFDYIVIEASGICEPGPIAQTICNIPNLVTPEVIGDTIPAIDCIITVVDALRMKDEFQCGHNLVEKKLDEEDIENLVIQQIEFCNRILLNKASEVSKEELGRIRQIIKTIQPKAEIIECDFCDVDFDKILHTRDFDFDSVALSAKWIQEIEGDPHEEENKEEDILLDSIIRLMDEYKRKMVIVLSMSEKSMKAHFSSNNETLSFVPYILHFPSQSLDDLWSYFSFLVSKEGYVCGKGVKEKVKEVLENNMTKENFAGRISVRRIFENAKMNMALRLSSSDFSTLPESTFITLKAQDFNNLS